MEKRNNISHRNCWAKRFIPHNMINNNNIHKHKISNAVKTALAKSNKNNKIKFIINKYFRNHRTLNQREKTETILLYPFLSVLFPNTKIKYPEGCTNNIRILYWNCNESPQTKLMEIIVVSISY